jgi:hypothetical protein
MAANVFEFTKAREPTVRAAKGFPPPFIEATFSRLRWQALRNNALRELGVSRCEPASQRQPRDGLERERRAAA